MENSMHDYEAKEQRKPFIPSEREDVALPWSLIKYDQGKMEHAPIYV